MRRPGGPPDGVNPRHSMLVLPFDNLRDDQSIDWLRDGSVSMLALNMSQWNDLTVVDHERVHDLLARHGLASSDDIGLDMARRLAREAGVWTVVLGDYQEAGDSLHLTARVFDVASGARVDVARGQRAGVRRPPAGLRPAGARLLDLSGAPNEVRAGLAPATTPSLEAYRSYLAGVERLNRWDLAAAQRNFQRAVEIDTTFGLAYYKLALTRGWLVGTQDSTGQQAIDRATAYSAATARARPRGHHRLPRSSCSARTPPRGTSTSSSWRGTRRTPTPGTASATPGSTTRRGAGTATSPSRCAPSGARWRWLPTTRWRTSTSRPC